ncbi:HEAT repeat domain-containing protein [Verrucomicrobia bacterium]|nr:HEAT repeat domain-containing protein [Verrucomicrobiota bacterium]
MLSRRFLPIGLALIASLCLSQGASVQELANTFKALPTVAEEDLPELSNKRAPFLGLIKHEGLKGHTWVQFPFVENPGSFGFDRKGRLFVAEANRFWLGTPDLRGANELIRGDFQSITVEDRQRLYDDHPFRFPEGWFTAVADRVIRLEDRDGNGAADHRSLFSDHFKSSLDGIGFSILAEDDGVYFTCIPKLWKMTDSNDDGVADTHESVVDGFGVRVSFIGHDLHGITRGPDGRLYFSIGDRGYHVTTQEGEVLPGSGRGAIFRCESDGSGFEVFAKGLRNPQELAFDEFGNLFTFDNTGDIGDVARMVYALEGSDSGWDMSHQSAHHYVTILDWESFHPETSMWVKEKMFETYNEEQPQWIYPPASHVARGPSGVTYLTGESIPSDLRNKFLLANYRGPSVNCTVLTIGVEPKGAGYGAVSEEVLVEGVGVTDVELGFDGNIYLCDFGGGWSVNENGAIQVLTPSSETQRAAGAKAKAWFEKGLSVEEISTLVTLLGSPDKRLRQMAQFELVERGKDGQSALVKVAADKSLSAVTRMHGIWGLGQLGRRGAKLGKSLLKLTRDTNPEVRANAARTIGSLKDTKGRNRLVKLLSDKSPRVRSLAAVALGRVAKKGDKGAIDALYQMAAQTGVSKLDAVLRHSCLSGLDLIGTVDAAVERAGSSELEVRMMALLYLRRHESAELVRFLGDSAPLIRREAVRAIYDTAAMDGPAGEALAALGTSSSSLPETIQRRVVGANYRLGQAKHARVLLAMAGESSLAASVREAALHGLGLWEKCIDTDPVLGHYRPQVKSERSMKDLGLAISKNLKQFLSGNQPPKLTALALKLSDATGVVLDGTTLRAKIIDEQLDSGVRVAALDSLVSAEGSKTGKLVAILIQNKDALVRAAAVRHGFAVNVNRMDEIGRRELMKGPLEAAREGAKGLFSMKPMEAASVWEKRESSGLRRELWLDVFLAIQGSEDKASKELAATFAATDKHAVFQLSAVGGSIARGESIFRNQGACMQCHKIGSDGGIQGPDLTKVGERLKSDKLVESLVDPGAVITPNYGMSSITLKDGTALLGRIAKQNKEQVSVVGLDGKPMELSRADIAEIAPPISAMPPLGAALPPRDLRDLIAFLSSRTTATIQAEAAKGH